jgi:hypothetical protein
VVIMTPLFGVVGRDAAAESHHLGAADVVLPTLRLNVDHIQAQLVLLDRPVDSTVARFAHYFSGVFQGAAIPHGHQQLDHNPLECLRANLL